MADTTVNIPDRELFKASEGCEIAGVQPYVLRSWESEFPTLGVARTPGGPRVYRRADVERVLQVKALVFGEGLTLAGARRRIEDAGTGAADSDPPTLVGPDTRKKLAAIKQDVRSLLDLLGQPPAAGGRKKGSVWSAQPTLLDDLTGGDAKPAKPPRTAAKSGAAKRTKA